MNRFYFLLIFLIFLISCSKSNISWTSATIQDLTGLDGCGLTIQLEDQSYLEPINLSDFSSTATISDNQKVWVKYQEIDGASFCMVGKIIEIKELQNR
jgi:hypothetical protein